MAVTVIPFSFPGLPGVRAAFTTAQGGFSAGPYAQANISFAVGDEADKVAQNRLALRDQLGFNSWHSLRQVHGTDMIFEPDPQDMTKPSGMEGDGLATAEPGMALVIKTADCQPILLAHASGRYVGALHVGWRGNVLEFPEKGVKAFCDYYGLRAKNVLAVRGPSLGPGASVFENFEMEFGKGYKDYYSAASKTVNLWKLTRDQLRSAGLKKDNIFGLDLCTHSLPLFFSYRRGHVTGRQAGLIWIEA
jgi:hypothetical protein